MTTNQPATANQPGPEQALESLGAPAINDRVAALSLIPEPWAIESLDAYHADLDCDSNSSLSLFASDRWAYYATRQLGQAPAREEESHFRWGHALHAMLEHGDWVDGSIAVMDTPENRGTKAFKAFASQHPGRHCLTHAEADKVQHMLEGIMRNPEAMRLIAGNVQREFALRWRDHLTGLGLKVCLDVLRDRLDIVDFKSSKDPRRASFRKAMYDYGYYRQSALYSRARDLYVGGEDWLDRDEPLGSFTYVVVGNVWPHECHVYPVGRATLAIGMSHVRKTLQSLRTCHDFSADGTSDAWHAPDHGTATEIELDEWAFKKEFNP